MMNLYDLFEETTVYIESNINEDFNLGGITVQSGALSIEEAFMKEKLVYLL